MIVEHQPTNEFVARRLLQFAQPRKVPATQRRGRLDLDADDASLLILEHEVDLITLFRTKMREGHACIAPADQLAQFGPDEALEERAEALGICLRRCRAEAAGA